MSDPHWQAEAESIIIRTDRAELGVVGGLRDVQDMMLMSADRNIYGAKNDILDAIERATSIAEIKRIHRACEEYMKAFDFLGARASRKWDELLNREFK